jgi:uncharacterized metal-binding protein
MPDSQTHDVLTVATGAAFAAPVFWLAGRMGLAGGEALTVGAAFLTAHLASGMLLSPDLDFDKSDLWGRSRGRAWSNRVLRRWGPIGIIWYPYARLLPHRSWISHGYVIGGIIRLAYLLSCIGCMIGIMALFTDGRILGPTLNVLYTIGSAHPFLGIALLGGIITGADVHVWADRHIRAYARRSK